MKLEELTARLFEACRSNNVKELLALQGEANINLAYFQQDDKGKVPFQVAIEEGHLGILTNLCNVPHALSSLFLETQGGSKILAVIEASADAEIFAMVNDALENWGGELVLNTLLPERENLPSVDEAAAQGGAAVGGAGVGDEGNEPIMDAAPAAAPHHDTGEERLKKRIDDIKKMTVDQLVHDMGEIQKVIHEELKSSGFVGDIFAEVRKTLFTTFTSIESEHVAEFYDPELVKLFGEACDHLGL